MSPLLRPLRRDYLSAGHQSCNRCGEYPNDGATAARLKAPFRKGAGSSPTGVITPPRRSGSAAAAELMPGRLLVPAKWSQVQTHPHPSPAAASPTSAYIL